MFETGHGIGKRHSAGRVHDIDVRPVSCAKVIRWCTPSASTARGRETSCNSRFDVARRNQFGLLLRDQFRIFAMGSNDDAQFLCQRHGAVQVFITDIQCAFVRQKNLER